MQSFKSAFMKCLLTNNLLSDIEGHFTTLSRNVQTQGPDVRLFVAWLSADETIEKGTCQKLIFSKAYADGLSNDELLEAIVITVDGTTISRDEYQINYNISDQYHEIVFEIKNYFNGINNSYSSNQFNLSREDYPELEASRFFYSWPVIEPYVNVVLPPLANQDGTPFEIILPDIALPDEEDRKYQIYVETDTNAGHVNINVNSSNSFIVSSFDNPITTNNFLGWYYDWYFPITNDSSIIEDNYRLTINVDTDDDLSTYEKTVIRDTSVALLEQVNVSTNDYDNDDDGILDEDELNIILIT